MKIFGVILIIIMLLETLGSIGSSKLSPGTRVVATIINISLLIYIVATLK